MEKKGNISARVCLFLLTLKIFAMKEFIAICIALLLLVLSIVFTAIKAEKLEKENAKLLVDYKNALVDYSDALTIIKQKNEAIEILKSEASKKNKCFYYVCNENGTVIVFKYYESLSKTKNISIKWVVVE